MQKTLKYIYIYDFMVYNWNQFYHIILSHSQQIEI